MPRLGVLLVGDEGEHDAAGCPAGRQLLGGDDERGDPALHVGRAAAEQAMALDPRGEGGVHAVDADRVEVSGEHHGGAGPTLRADRDEAGPVVVTAGGHDVGVETAVQQPVPQVLDDVVLAGGPWREARVDRVDAHEGRRQCDGLLAELGGGASRRRRGGAVVDGHPATLRRRTRAAGG